MRTLQRLGRCVKNGHVQIKRPRVHPLRGMPHTVQVRRIEIGGADVESRAGFPPQKNAADMPIKIRRKQPSGKRIRRSVALIAPRNDGGNYFSLSDTIIPCSFVGTLSFKLLSIKAPYTQRSLPYAFQFHTNSHSIVVLSAF